MKYLLFGDIHGKDLKKLEKTILAESPDTLVCLGDFDHVKSIREFMDIEKEYLKQGKNVIKVPGNHDYAVLHNKPLESGTLNVYGKSVFELNSSLKKDKEAHDYLFNLVNSDLFVRGNLDEEKFGDAYPFVVVHGGYTGDDRKSQGYSEELKPMWYRMKTEEDFHMNANEMRMKGEKVMIRGHDHFPSLSINDSETTERELHSPMKGSKFKLSSKKEQIITPGAYFYRDFAIIDTAGKEPIVEYRADLEGLNKLPF
jgi:predicted phosphodiesterase